MLTSASYAVTSGLELSFDPSLKLAAEMIQHLHRLPAVHVRNE